MKRVSLRDQLATATRALKQYEASTLHTYRDAYHKLTNTSKDQMMASGVIVTIAALGGRELVPTFMISDGLSADTIAALQRDILAAHTQSIRLNLICTKETT